MVTVEPDARSSSNVSPAGTVKPLMTTVVHLTASETSSREEMVPVHAAVWSHCRHRGFGDKDTSITYDLRSPNSIVVGRPEIKLEEPERGWIYLITQLRARRMSRSSLFPKCSAFNLGLQAWIQMAR